MEMAPEKSGAIFAWNAGSHAGWPDTFGCAAYRCRENREQAAVAGALRAVHLAAVTAGDLANEAEAKAVAAVGFAGAAHAVEGREDGDALSGTNMKCEQQPGVNGWARLASQRF
jgi:hypothetical protein